METDPQLILPQLILKHTPLFAQVMFFGALLSALKSCASATLLAPSVSVSENIIKGTFKHLTQRQMLVVMRLTVLVFTVMVTILAMHSELSIFKMVESAYKVTLVAAFIPLVFGIYWKKSNPMGGLLSILFGLSSWLLAEFAYSDGIFPPQMIGLFMSLFGMIAGSLLISSDLVKEAETIS
jgi:Na+/proline symporter